MTKWGRIFDTVCFVVGSFLVGYGGSGFNMLGTKNGDLWAGFDHSDRMMLAFGLSFIAVGLIRIYWRKPN